jgi:alpha-D-ribose 1-methylphosphonate 5-triphosphate synthase subunit PhnI
MTLPEAIEVLRAFRSTLMRDAMTQAIDTVLAHFDEPEGPSDGAIYSAYSRRDADPELVAAVDAFDPLAHEQTR